MELKNWLVINNNETDGKKSLEDNKRCLRGEVYGSDRYKNGTLIATSNIVKVEGNQATTRHGSVYILGKPDEEYKKWCEKKNIPLI